jgi:hypothetical protein
MPSLEIRTPLHGDHQFRIASIFPRLSPLSEGGTAIAIHGVCTHPGRDETAVQLLEKETLQTEDLPRLDLSKLMAGKKAPHHVGGQAVAPARDGDDVGTVALRGGSY